MQAPLARGPQLGFRGPPQLVASAATFASKAGCHHTWPKLGVTRKQVQCLARVFDNLFLGLVFHDGCDQGLRTTTPCNLVAIFFVNSQVEQNCTCST